jgi:hypothetical protein
MYLSIVPLPMYGPALAGLQGRSAEISGAQIITSGCLTLVY